MMHISLRCPKDIPLSLPDSVGDTGVSAAVQYIIHPSRKREKAGNQLRQELCNGLGAEHPFHGPRPESNGNPIPNSGGNIALLMTLVGPDRPRSAHPTALDFCMGCVIVTADGIWGFWLPRSALPRGAQSSVC